jgi:hypothetical protein
VQSTITEHDSPALKVIEGLTFDGTVNTAEGELRAHIRHAIRQQHAQVRPQPLQQDRICLVAGGPSLESTFDELRELHFEGAKVVTLNGAYHWCLERNIRPSAQIILDARAHNVRFVEPAVPRCKYLLASQVHPDVWAAVKDREDVRIWHASGGDPDVEAMLTAFYGGQWMEIGHGPVGGTTVLVRAIALLRTLGFLRFDLFGADSCVMAQAHHAYPQPENDRDKVVNVRVTPSEGGETRVFRCTAWHLKQLEDFLRMVRATGNEYVLHVHGDGLLAYALTASAALTVSTEEKE